MKTSDPDFEKARSVVKAGETFVEEVVIRVMAKYSNRNLIAIVLAAFSLGGFMYSIKADISAIKATQVEAAEATKNRLSDWTPWRSQTDKRIAETENRIKTTGSSRFTNMDYDTAVWMVMTRSPNLWMPYYREIKREQGKP